MIKRNILANMAGKIYAAFIGFIVLPFYIKYLGSESYGLVGVFAVIQAFALLFDSGITPMVTREFARLSEVPNSAAYLNNLLKTTERLLLLVGLTAFFCIYAFSGFIASQWINADNLSPDSIAYAITLMGIIIGLRFNTGLYGGTVMALEKQVQYNVVLAVISTIRSIGVIFVLAYVASDVKTFFLFETFVALAEIFSYRYLVLRFMPKSSENIRFDLSIYKHNWKFISGYSMSMIFTFILLQSDKVILSKVLPLGQFGYYIFAWSITSVLQVAVSPIFQAINPRLAAIYSLEKHSLGKFYHQACQLVGSVAIPVGLFVAFFSKELILLWTGNEEMTSNVFLLVRLLSVGTLLNILATMPGLLQTAAGKTKIMVIINGLSVLLVFPLNFILGKMFGGVGPAFVWIGLNVIYLFVGIYIHAKFLNEAKMKWFIEDLLKPLCSAAICLFILKWLFDMMSLDGLFLNILSLMIIFSFSLICVIALLPNIKAEAVDMISNFRRINEK